MAGRKKQNFEENLERLEKIVETMSGDLDLNKSLELFEEGMKLVKNNQETLKNAKLKVNKIIKEYGEYSEIPFKEIEK